MIVAGFHERGEGNVEHRQGKFAKEFGFDGWCASWEIGFLGGSTGLFNARAPLLYSGSAAGAAGVGGALRWLSRAQHVIAPLPGPAIALEGISFFQS